MSSVLIRNIDEETLNRLKLKAERNSRSLQGELLEILKASVNPNIDETRDMVNELLAEYRAEGRMFSDSTDDLREDRDR